MQLSTTLSKPAFGLLADYTNRMKAVLVCLICAEVLLNMSMLVIPAAPEKVMPLSKDEWTLPPECGNSSEVSYDFCF